LIELLWEPFHSLAGVHVHLPEPQHTSSKHSVCISSNGLHLPMIPEAPSQFFSLIVDTFPKPETEFVLNSIA
jgi:hypothetical protein